MDKKRFSKIKCTNCGQFGHAHKTCHSPITSYGILALSLNQTDPEKSVDLQQLVKYLSSINKFEQHVAITCDNLSILENFSKYKDIVKVLLIMRKHSLGYTEFVRGRYAVANPSHIAFLFKQMTPAELDKIKNNDFDYLWSDMWSLRKPIIKHEEYIMSREKYMALSEMAPIRLSDFLKNTTPDNIYPEWGIPKGRRERDESDINCALREFKEETGYTHDDFILFENIEPLVEDLIGTNGLKYRHVYFIALLTTQVQPTRSDDNLTQRQEIGDIGLFGLDESIQKIRTYHTERRNILFSVCLTVMNFFIMNHKAAATETRVASTVVTTSPPATPVDQSLIKQSNVSIVSDEDTHENPEQKTTS